MKITLEREGIVIGDDEVPEGEVWLYWRDGADERLLGKITGREEIGDDDGETATAEVVDAGDV